ncbi:hypothetical protein FRX31_002538 [Thalictrum thalictroides]|uniref:Uncharacterized protein n=1 Tax=Thalictrum thalictroides TaxID=46969 RepID=A0A7J6XFZ7_THATH|nr:hypothetical protein FRX31_002538 [Thalictrum thalictroides]
MRSGPVSTNLRYLGLPCTNLWHHTLQTLTRLIVDECEHILTYMFRGRRGLMSTNLRYLGSLGTNLWHHTLQAPIRLIMDVSELIPPMFHYVLSLNPEPLA